LFNGLALACAFGATQAQAQALPITGGMPAATAG